jgi:hypothetical protein
VAKATAGQRIGLLEAVQENETKPVYPKVRIPAGDSRSFGSPVKHEIGGVSIVVK